MSNEVNTLTDLSGEITHCVRCSLSETRKQPVPGWFPDDAEKILFIADAPTSVEDASGLPLIGHHGTKFSQMVYEEMDLLREEYNVTYCVKCLPVYNGKVDRPRREALFWCAEHLYKQIELIQPKLIVSLGYTPFFVLLRRNSIDFAGIAKISMEDYLGKIYLNKTLPPVSELEVPTIVTYDPAAWAISKKHRKAAREHFEFIGQVWNDIKAGESIEHLLRSRDEIQ